MFQSKDIGLKLLQSTGDSLIKIGMKISGKTPLWNDFLINSAKGDTMMSFNCFIIFVGRLLGPMLLLAFRSQIRLFFSSIVVGVIKKVKLLGFFRKLEKCFLISQIFFFVMFSQYLWRNCWNVQQCFSSVMVLPSWIIYEGEFLLFLFLE